MMRVILMLLVAIYGLKAKDSFRSIFDLNIEMSSLYFRQALLLRKLCICENVSLCINMEDREKCEDQVAKDCMENYISDVGKALSQGVEELDIPKYEPYDLRESYWTTFNWNAHDDVGTVKLTNISISGISNFTVTDFTYEQFNQYIEPFDVYMYFVVHYSKLYLTAKCYLNGTFGSFLNSQGDKLQVTLKDFDFNVGMGGRYYYEDAVKYVTISEVVVGNYKMVIGSLNLSFAHDSANLSSNQPYYWHWTEYNKILWTKIEPDIQMAAAKFIMNIVDKINHNFTASELLPFP